MSDRGHAVELWYDDEDGVPLVDGDVAVWSAARQRFEPGVSAGAAPLFAGVQVTPFNVSGGSPVWVPLSGVNTASLGSGGATSPVIKTGVNGMIGKGVLLAPPFSAGTLECEYVELDCSNEAGTQRLAVANYSGIGLLTSDESRALLVADLPDVVEQVGVDLTFNDAAFGVGFHSAAGGVFTVSMYARFVPTDLA